MNEIDTVLRLGAGMLIGLVIGLEREISRRPAGMRTHFLVSLGAVAVTIAGNRVSQQIGGDPFRLAAQVVSGIGFLGAGTILKEGITVRGLTTAASLWVSACLAIVAGYGLFFEAALGTVGVLIALTILERAERYINFTRISISALLDVNIDKNSHATESILLVLTRQKIETQEISLKQTDDGTQMTILVFAKTKKMIVMAIEEISLLPGIKQAVYKAPNDYHTASL